MKSVRGFTLIELLVSITIGLILITITASALVQISRLAKRDTAQRQARDDAGIMYRGLHENFESVYHPSQMRFEADPGSDGWGSGDETITMVWMSTVRHARIRDMGVKPWLINELVWNELKWVGWIDDAGQRRGRLYYAISSRSRDVEGHSYTISGDTYDPDITTIPQVRRDRRRDMDDNDLRFVPGISTALYTTLDMPGDREDLATNSRPFHPPTTEVTNCVFEWVDAEGYTVTCDPQSGISIVDENGSAVSLLSTDYSQAPGTGSHIHVIDGIFQDGREYIPAGDTRPARAQRPAVIRLGMTLVTTSQSGLDLAEEPTFDFQFSFSTASKLPSL